MNAQYLAALDLSVALIEGWTPGTIPSGIEDEPEPINCWFFEGHPYPSHTAFHKDGAAAMKLLEKYRLGVSCTSSGKGWACIMPYRTDVTIGPTPAIAICRAVVALKEKT